MGGIQILLGGISPFNALVMLKLTYVYIKAKVKKWYNRSGWATNETCVGWLDENSYMIENEWHF